MKNWHRQNDSVVTIDKNGNVISDIVIKPNEEIVIKKIKTPKQLKFLKDMQDLSLYGNELGGYVHMFYVKNELLFNHLNIDRASISRLIYLSTYIDYNDRQENLLVKYGQNKKVEPMTRKYIQKILRLSDTTFKSFISNMKKNNLIYELNNKFYISNEYFSKGKCDFNNKEYTRIFINTTRFLYENVSIRQHKQLSYVFQLIPMIHYETNTIAFNPDEMDNNKILKMGLKDICEFLGVYTDNSTMYKLENELYKLKVDVYGVKYYFFKRVILKDGDGTKDYFIVNPQVIWGGKDTDAAKDIINNLIFNS